MYYQFLNFNTVKYLKKYIMKKPPDKYRCIKVPFNKIIKNNETKYEIFDYVIRTNKITIKTYQFLK